MDKLLKNCPWKAPLKQVVKDVRMYICMLEQGSLRLWFKPEIPGSIPSSSCVAIALAASSTCGALSFPRICTADVLTLSCGADDMACSMLGFLTSPQIPFMSITCHCFWPGTENKQQNVKFCFKCRENVQLVWQFFYRIYFSSTANKY